jgi:glutathione S-transferase
MQLYYSSTSPYSRKVRLCLFEKGIADQVDEILVNPFADETSSAENKALISANPLSKIPTLITDSGDAIFDSRVICQFIDNLAGNISLIPKDKAAHLATLRWEAIADGLTDAAYNLVIERRRPAEEQSPTWIANWSADIQRTLQYIEKHLNELDGDISLAYLALAAAISYLDFRLPETLYQSAFPQVAVCPDTLDWYQAFKTRPAMQATKLM